LDGRGKVQRLCLCRYGEANRRPLQRWLPGKRKCGGSPPQPSPNKEGTAAACGTCLGQALLENGTESHAKVSTGFGWSAYFATPVRGTTIVVLVLIALNG